MSEAIRQAWNFIYRRFYNPENDLIYDFVVDETGNAWWHLPPPYAIQRDKPNPCGWGVGMEDSVLSAGSVIDALVGAYAVKPQEDVKALTYRLFDGMARCATVPAAPGFISRSLSPVDGVSHYSDTSRDQYTHWVYAAMRLYRSPMSTADHREIIRQVLTALAEKCDREVTADNDWQLLRADGGVSVVGKMWGTINPHEYLRLPMFYLAAYAVTGDEHWKTQYMTYRDEALERSEDYRFEGNRGYVTLQLQYSLRLCYDLDEELAFRERVKALMTRLAAHCEQVALARGTDLAKPEMRETFTYRYRPWDTVPDPTDLGVIGGKRYVNPAQSERRENRALYPIREVGEAASVAAICPGYRVQETLLSTLEAVAANIDYRRHCTYAPMLLVCGYALCLENRREKETAEGAKATFLLY